MNSSHLGLLCFWFLSQLREIAGLCFNYPPCTVSWKFSPGSKLYQSYNSSNCFPSLLALSHLHDFVFFVLFCFCFSRLLNLKSSPEFSPWVSSLFILCSLPYSSLCHMALIPSSYSWPLIHFSSLDLTLEPQTSFSNCPHDVLISMSNCHLKLNRA